MGLGTEKLNAGKGITVAEYVKSLQEDKQAYDIKEDATDFHLDNQEPETVDVETEQNPEQVDIIDTLGTNDLADFIVSTLNVSYNVFARAFSQGYIDSTPYEARADELDSIKKPLKAYLKTKSINMSPGTALLIAILIVYAPKTFMLVNAKKQAVKELKEKNEQEG